MRKGATGLHSRNTQQPRLHEAAKANPAGQARGHRVPELLERTTQHHHCAFLANKHQTNQTMGVPPAPFTSVKVMEDRADGSNETAEPRGWRAESWDRTSGETEAMLSPRGGLNGVARLCDGTMGHRREAGR